MSLEYYLYCRKSYDKIIKELEEIINTYIDICSFTNGEEIERNYVEIFSTDYNKNFFVNRKKHIEQLRKICDRKVNELCCHNMIEDLIDISPFKSQIIRYCSICEYTENK
jgi:hypothetical protein